MIEQNFSLHYGGEIEINVGEVVRELCRLRETEQGGAEAA